MAASIVRRLRPPAGEAYAYLLANLERPAAGEPTLIFAQGRSGSTLLESLLASTGHFTAKGEILGQEGTRIRFPVAYLRGQARRRADKTFLCHVKIYHLTRDRREAGRPVVEPRVFLRRLADDGWHILYLRRSDRVRQALSNIVAEVRGSYHKLDDRPETTVVHVSRQRLRAMVAQRMAFEAQEREALAGIDFHEVVYERDLEDASKHQQTVDRILDLLALPRRPVSTPLRKVNARPLREVVLNYRQLAAWLEEMDLQGPATGRLPLDHGRPGSRRQLPTLRRPGIRPLKTINH